MKWDRENRKRLGSLLLEKLNGIKDVAGGRIAFRHNLRMAFLREFGIERVERKRRLGDNQGRKLWVKLHTQNPARNKDRIIIPDPWGAGSSGRITDAMLDCGLSIPKDIAEKFLVLGIP
jgi:hypothetical protein